MDQPYREKDVEEPPRTHGAAFRLVVLAFGITPVAAAIAYVAWRGYREDIVVPVVGTMLLYALIAVAMFNLLRGPENEDGAAWSTELSIAAAGWWPIVWAGTLLFMFGRECYSAWLLVKRFAFWVKTGQ